ncbi:MAG: signal peptidase I [Bdellovibrionota bacterium]|jgi:signal peptidase I
MDHLNESQSEKQTQSIDTVSEIKSFIKSVIVLVILIIILRGSIIEAFRIPSASMRPTLIEQDHILVTKFDYGLRAAFFPKTLYQFTTPKRGDIVVFTQENEPETNIIKRVIGLAGETFEVKGRQVFINGKELQEPENIKWLDGGKEDFGPVTIPEGHVIVLGDNRDHSRDSRYWNNPFLDIKLIKGKAKIIYFNWVSLSRAGTLIK